MNNMYEIAGFSKQAHNQYMKRRQLDEEIAELIINMIIETRQMHPVIGLKKIYSIFKPDYIGRDRFIRIGVENGLGIKRLKSYTRTTYSNRHSIFSNLTIDLPVVDINQVWVSDITYYRVGDIFYYLTFIMDVFSRRILGYTAYPTLEAKANCQALNMAIENRAGRKIDKLIHHSDRGTQYTSNSYLKILSDSRINVSMCESVYENSHIERVNGIIKNEYLINWKINDFESLRKGLDRAVYIYNNERPHGSILLKKPVEYEIYLNNIPLTEREPMFIFKSEYMKKDPNYYLQTGLFN